VLAGLISLGFLGVLVGTVRRRAEVGRLPVVLGLVAAVVLVIQVILGGLTVLELLAEWTVTSHLLSGNTFCMLLMLLAFALSESAKPVERPAVGWGSRVAAAGMAVLVPLQLALGGLVASSHAGLACGTWPTCDGSTWFPTFSGLVGYQLMHRLMAYALLAAAVAGVAMARGRTARPARLLFLLVLIQAGIGIANVLTRMPVEITLAHSAGAAAVWLCTAWFNWEAWRAPVAVTMGGAEPELGSVALEGA
jgi:cytochrome c oxidase assembly protein subunit 15